MDVADLTRRTVEVRTRVAEFERKHYVTEWTATDLMSCST